MAWFFGKIQIITSPCFFSLGLPLQLYPFHPCWCSRISFIWRDHFPEVRCCQIFWLPTVHIRDKQPEVCGGGHSDWEFAENGRVPAWSHLLQTSCCHRLVSVADDFLARANLSSFFNRFLLQWCWESSLGHVPPQTEISSCQTNQPGAWKCSSSIPLGQLHLPGALFRLMNFKECVVLAAWVTDDALTESPSSDG